MKLVDILARELRAWPKGFGKSVGQCHHGAIHSCGLPYLQSGQKFTRCDNYMTDVVSRGQWQAAVDALKAPEIAAPEWNGEGLPPVGVACEWRDDDSGIWQVVEILYLSKATALIKFVDYKDGDCEACYSPSSCQFRPIRTPEQIEQQEIQKIRDAIGWKRPQLGACPVEQMYLLGYRKFEIVDK